MHVNWLYRPKIFIYFSDFFDVMALKVSYEFVAEAVYYKVGISCEKAVVRDLCITAVSLYGIYTTSKLVARAIDGIVNRGLGGPRKDQGITDSTQRLHIPLPFHRFRRHYDCFACILYVFLSGYARIFLRLNCKVHLKS
jgi:hypothetical protein